MPVRSATDHRGNITVQKLPQICTKHLVEMEKSGGDSNRLPLLKLANSQFFPLDPFVRSIGSLMRL